MDTETLRARVGQIFVVVAALLVSGCSFDFTLERDVVDDAFNESVAVMSTTLGERDHRVDAAYEWHKDLEAGCLDHRYARWELSRFDEHEAEAALDRFTKAANAAGFSVGRSDDSEETPGISFGAYHWDGDGIDTGYWFEATVQDSEAALRFNRFLEQNAVNGFERHLLPESGQGWAEVDLTSTTGCVREDECGNRPPADDDEQMAIWLECVIP